MSKLEKTIDEVVMNSGLLILEGAAALFFVGLNVYEIPKHLWFHIGQIYHRNEGILWYSPDYQATYNPIDKHGLLKHLGFKS